MHEVPPLKKAKSEVIAYFENNIDPVQTARKGAGFTVFDYMIKSNRK